jgi:hypothetical protein
MATYTWGSGGGYTFAANSIGTDTKLCGASADQVALTRLEFVVDGTTFCRYRMQDGSGAAAADDGGGSQNLALSGTYAWEWDVDYNYTRLDLDSNGNATKSFTAGANGDPWCIQWWARSDFTNLPASLTQPQLISLGSYPNGRGHVRKQGRLSAIVHTFFWMLGSGSANWTYPSTVDGPTDELLHHYALQYSSALGTSFYKDGVKTAGGTPSVTPTAGASVTLRGNSFGTTGAYEKFNAFHYTGATLFDANFTPYYYNGSGTRTLQHAASGETLDSIAWTATTNAARGAVSAIHVNTGSNETPNWVAVGGANPTSPLTGLNYTVPTNCVRFTLATGTDTYRRQTPVLLTATLGLTAGPTYTQQAVATASVAAARLVGVAPLRRAVATSAVTRGATAMGAVHSAHAAAAVAPGSKIIGTVRTAAGACAAATTRSTGALHSAVGSAGAFAARNVGAIRNALGSCAVLVQTATAGITHYTQQAIAVGSAAVALARDIGAVRIAGGACATAVGRSIAFGATAVASCAATVRAAIQGVVRRVVIIVRP